MLGGESDLHHSSFAEPACFQARGKRGRAHHRPQPPALGLRVATPTAAALAARATQSTCSSSRSRSTSTTSHRRDSTSRCPWRACIARVPLLPGTLRGRVRRVDRHRCASSCDAGIAARRRARRAVRAADPVVLHADAGAGDDRRVRRARRRLRLHGRAVASSASRPPSWSTASASSCRARTSCSPAATSSRSRRRSFTPNVHFFGCGVDVAHFANARSADVEVPREIAVLTQAGHRLLRRDRRAHRLRAARCARRGVCRTRSS